MYRERVRTIGISLLGGNSGVEGQYELGIDSIRAVNVEDVTDTSALGTPRFLLLSPAFSFGYSEKAPTEGTQWQRPPVL